MPISDLPPELIQEHIISNIDNYDTVEACTLVCSAWRAAAQPIIFRSVRLADPYTSAGTMCYRFHQLLTMSPHLAQYVTHIAIADGMQERRWLARQEQKLSFILPLLINVKHISISFVDLPYPQLSLSLRNALRTLFRAPHVKDITLRGMRDLPGWNEFFFLLSGCTAERVSLYAFTVSSASNAISIRQKTPATPRVQTDIRMLEVDIEPDEMKKLALWLDNPGACVDMSTLKTFAYRSIRLADIGACSQVVRTRALENLETLQLIFPDVGR
ncbi:hypothetical protein CYLTODRAFT_35299 [Cylindrobasidium torrendii FP15055 ss-10]|uniref:Uncharacterized protein n=1 Tax=Cylindrobasidium torrendii FP15055 ss-10 TaxID=1314674 RepID=A0A0D7B6Z8_9AGAR|nr:hypothetical protein CYLTODRAFT_35299 [Cylindrobasidium torrendii FP15055 ss-10]